MSSFDELLLHPRTLVQLQKLTEEPSHGILLTGGEGYGKETIARTIVAEVLGSTRSESVLAISAGPTNTIGIEAIKEIKNFVKLKTLGKNRFRRAIMIFNGELMTNEAQNALLKTLEEPPADTLIIITSAQPKLLLPTIASRVITLRILPVPAEAMQSYFADIADEPRITQAALLSGGAVGLATALLSESEDHQLAAAVREAKSLLASSVFARLASIDTYTKNKHHTRLLLEALSRIGQATLQQVAKQSKTQSVTAWHKRLERIQEAREQLTTNASLKLILTDLFLAL